MRFEVRDRFIARSVQLLVAERAGAIAKGVQRSRVERYLWSVAKVPT
jgi:hypothetical protein